MADLDQVRAQIRFGLDQLSSQNAHHDFEHLCRHLTRHRICSNIVPSTGPVSAGGDLGRDFETFRTYLSSTEISESTFLGLVSDKTIVFACSLERGIKEKIKRDIEKIMGSDAPVEEIQYFSSTDIQTSQKHALKKWAADEYSVGLEIYDGQAISELLANREVFWIAERYLSIPAEVFPPPPAKKGDEWYGDLLKEWKEKKDCSIFNHSDFLEIKSALRHATFTEPARQDLTFWIGLTERIIAKVSPKKVKRKAVYELAVASLRGLGSLEGLEERIREYFKKIPELSNPSEVEDASILLTYCMGAVLNNCLNVPMKELINLRSDLIETTQALLELAKGMPNLECKLLEVRGFQSFTFDPVKKTFFDIDEAFARWIEVTELAKKAHLFPLERFADRLTEYVKISHQAPSLAKVDNHPLYEEISHRVDNLLEERFGGFKAAQKCADRALAFYDAGEPIKAINQLHRAKIKWLANETFQASLSSLLFIAKCYSDLGLSFAAKYYASAAAFAALASDQDEVKDKVSQGIIAAAEHEYRHGAWCGFLELAHTGIHAHRTFSKEAFHPLDRENRTIFHIVTILAIAERIAPDLAEFVQEIGRRLNMAELIEGLIPTARKVWDGKTASEIWDALSNQLEGKPFSDLGANRETRWSALGITWNVSWQNNYETTPSAEQFVALLQILLADLAGIDLCLLKTNVKIHLSLGETGQPDIQMVPSNMGRIWNISWPRLTESGRTPLEKIQAHVLASAISILVEASLLPKDKLMNILEDRYREGLPMKVYVAAPYEALYNEFITKEIFALSNKNSHSPPKPPREYPLREHPELCWSGGPGPGYSRQLAEEYLKNRYSRLLTPIRYTLRKLVKTPDFMATVNRLKADGWLDWHILSAVTSFTINYRVNQIPEARNSLRAQQTLFMRMMNQPEKNDPLQVPNSLYTEKALREFLFMNQLATLKTLSLECKQETPDLEAIDHFLRHRYNYWTDDIDHEDPFKESV